MPTSDIEQEAINIVDEEKNSHGESEVFITEKVAMAMKPLIRNVRKNYWGFFDKPKDPITGRDKIWVPLTRFICDTVRKNTDIDQKDFNFRSKRGKSGLGVTQVVKAKFRDILDRKFIGEDINQTVTNLTIDGTVVWKTIETEDGFDVRQIDLLNVFIDPTEKSIQDAYRFTERALMTEQEVKRMDGWMNTDKVEAQKGLSQSDTLLNLQGNRDTTSKYVDVYEMWGKIPARLLDRRKGDQEVDGHIVVSGLDAGNPLVHKIEENTRKDKEGNIIKPYEEAWYLKLPNRWYGVGIAETLLSLQTWINTVVNIRINRNYLAQLGIFKIRRGAGITPEDVSRIGSNGAIKVQNMDDIQQLAYQEATQGSYTDEGQVVSWAQRVSSAFESVTGEQLPSTTTATAASIQQRSARSAFTLVKENLGGFLQRWVDRHALKHVAESLKNEDIVRIDGGEDEIENLRERIALNLAVQELEEADEVPNEQEFQEAIQEARERLADEDGLFISQLEEVVAEDLDTQFYVTNEELDVGVTANNLIQLLQVSPDERDVIVPEIYNLLGIDVPANRFNKEALPAQQQQQAQLQGEAQQTVQARTGNLVAQ